MKHTNNFEEVVNMKPVGFPTISIISTQGQDALEITDTMLEDYNNDNGGEFIRITTNTFKRIISSVENDTFKITVTQNYVGLNPEVDNVVLARDYCNMVLRNYSTWTSVKDTVFSYTFIRADMVDKFTDD